MTTISAKAFRGKVPRLSPRLLPPNFGAEALNHKITSGRLDPIKGPLVVHTSLAAAIAGFCRYRFAGVDNWLVWGRAVDVARSPTAQDALGRLYWSGDGEPRMTTAADAINGGGPYPAAWYVLGVYIPVTAPSLAVVGGAGTTESRSYLYTFKTQYEEEGAPSPEVVVSGFIDGSWNLSAMEAAPPNSGTVTAAATVAQGVVEVTLDTNRGLAQYEEVTFNAVTGMTSLNATVQVLSVLPGNKVRVALDTAQVYAAGGTWARRAPHNLTGMVKCIYRAIGTNQDYHLVGEIPVGDTTYDDTIPSTTVASARTLSTLSSYTPPKNLTGMRELANGCVGGVAGNEVCFSEPYKPYSWPLDNRYAFAGVGVGTVATLNTLIVLTDSYPISATASVPEAASVGRIPSSPYAPCVNKLSIVQADGGGYFASNDGLYFVGPDGCRKVTDQVYTYDEWQVIAPTTMKAAYWDGRYYAMHDGTGDTPGRILVMALPNPDSVVEVDERIDAIYANPFDGKLYIARGKQIAQWDADDANRYLSFWQSPEYELHGLMNFTCAQVFARYTDIVPLDTSIQAANAALMADLETIVGAFGDETAVVPWGGTNLEEVPDQTANKVQMTLLSEGNVLFTKDLNSEEPFTLPSDTLYQVLIVQLTSTIPVFSVALAQDMDELAETGA